MSLLGRPVPVDGRRDAVQAWARALGIETAEHRWRSGGATVTGCAEQRETRHGACTIALTADIYDDDAGENKD